MKLFGDTFQCSTSWIYSPYLMTIKAGNLPQQIRAFVFSLLADFGSRSPERSSAIGRDGFCTQTKRRLIIAEEWQKQTAFQMKSLKFGLADSSHLMHR